MATEMTKSSPQICGESSLLKRVLGFIPNVSEEDRRREVDIIIDNCLSTKERIVIRSLYGINKRRKNLASIAKILNQTIQEVIQLDTHARLKMVEPFCQLYRVTFKQIMEEPENQKEIDDLTTS